MAGPIVYAVTIAGPPDRSGVGTPGQQSNPTSLRREPPNHKEGPPLASVDFLRRQGQPVRLASYDERMLRGATALGIDVYPL
ncbi:hypothetical protein L6Q96_18220 [Candidatus Binatia bacterium]|nr:hypothetical protein [Candidatus Binatia bacterium]